jgi:hypothetical protein
LPQVELGGEYLFSKNLRLEISYLLAGSSAPVFDSSRASFRLHSAQATGVLGLPLASWLNALAKGGGSMGFATLTFTGEGLQDPSQTVLVPMAHASLGLEASAAPPDSSVSLVATVEAGYEWAFGETRFDSLRGDVPSKARPKPIGVVGSHVGGLQLDGWLLRAGLQLRF